MYSAITYLTACAAHVILLLTEAVLKGVIDLNMDLQKVLEGGRGGDLSIDEGSDLGLATTVADCKWWDSEVEARKTVVQHFHYLGLCATFLPVIVGRSEWRAGQTTVVGKATIENWSTRTGTSTVSNEAFMQTTLDAEWEQWRKLYERHGPSMKSMDTGNGTSVTTRDSSARSKGGTFKGYWDTETTHDYYNAAQKDVEEDRLTDGELHDRLYSNYMRATGGRNRLRKRNRDPPPPVARKRRTVVYWGDTISNEADV